MEYEKKEIRTEIYILYIVRAVVIILTKVNADNFVNVIMK